MKRILTAVLLCLLALLCGCAKKPEAEPLAQEAVSVPAAAEPEIVPETAEPKPEASEPEPIPDGIVTINGRAFYYENGQPITGSGVFLSAQTAHIFRRRHACNGAELAGKVLLAGKAELLRDLAHGHHPAAQQELALLRADLCDIRARRHAEL